MGFLKKLMYLGLLGLVGWGMYHAGENNLFSFLSSESEKQIEVVKKEHAVKPRSIFRKVRDVVPAPVKQYDYTFLETLESVDLERYVDLDGKIKVMKKTVHSWVDEVEKVIDEPRILLASFKKPDSDSRLPTNSLTSFKEPVRATEKWKAPLASYKEPDSGSEKPSDSYEDIIKKLDDLMKEQPKKKVTPSVMPSGSAKRAVPSTLQRKPYRVQVSSFRKLNHARKLESDLRRKGYAAFVMSVQVSPSKGRWYRVFLGDYRTEGNARAAAQRAQRLHNLKTLVLKTSR